MNLEKRFVAIQSFLHQHCYLHELEALERSPINKSPYQAWMTEINKLNESDVIALENNLESDLVQDQDYRTFLKEVKKLQTLSQQKNVLEEIPKKLLSKISKKKQHEILVIQNELAGFEYDEIVDIGSGAGHLSSVLISENQKKAHCIDQSSEYQEIGKRKLKKLAPEILERIDFQHQTFVDETPIKTSKSSLLIGLHACGDLSPIILGSFQKNEFSLVLNYGCCFHKLTEKYLNLSQTAQKNPLKFNKYNLTLATKSYKTQSLKTYKEKLRVKNFRYTLHLFVQKKLNKDFESLGNAKKEDYLGNFSDYAFKYMPELCETTTQEELNDFYICETTQNQVKQILSLGVLRSHLARLIELYIILDRALWLNEKGYEVKITESFDRSLSPRNISLLAQKRLPRQF